MLNTSQKAKDPFLWTSCTVLFTASEGKITVWDMGSLPAAITGVVRCNSRQRQNYLLQQHNWNAVGAAADE